MNLTPIVPLQGAFIKGGGGPGAFGRMSQGQVDPRSKEEIQTVAGGPSTWSNPTGRVSVQFAPGAVSLCISYLINLQARCKRSVLSWYKHLHQQLHATPSFKSEMS